jgi:hypothetical protein
MTFRSFTVALLAVSLAACASAPQISGRVRPPIDPAQVRIYHVPPAGYEEVAQLSSASGPLTYGEQNKLNTVIAKLRREAAKLGANGVLLIGMDDGYGGGGVSIGGGVAHGGGHTFSGGGVGIDITPRPKYAYGVAIYVADPPPLVPSVPAGE